jgi:DNA-binding transcriptional MerR regulator
MRLSTNRFERNRPVALKFTVEALDTIPEAQRSLYTPTEDGKFRLDVDIEDQIKAATSTANREAAQYRHQVKAWKDLGKTPEEIQALMEAQRQADEEKLTKAGEWDKLKSQMLEQQAKEIEAREARLKAKDAAIERYLVDAQATAAIAAAKGVAPLLLPHVKSGVRVIEEDGEFKVRVVDDKGTPRVNGKGEYLSIADLVGEMRASDVFGRAFEPDGTTGGGAQQSRGGASQSIKGKVDGTEAERTAYFASKYPELK